MSQLLVFAKKKIHVYNLNVHDTAYIHTHRRHETTMVSLPKLNWSLSNIGCRRECHSEYFRELSWDQSNGCGKMAGYTTHARLNTHN